MLDIDLPTNTASNTCSNTQTACTCAASFKNVLHDSRLGSLLFEEAISILVGLEVFVYVLFNHYKHSSKMKFGYRTQGLGSASGQGSGSDRVLHRGQGQSPAYYLLTFNLLSISSSRGR